MRARLALALLALCFPLGIAVDSASSQMANPEPLTKPIDVRWREPFIRFLHELGTQDAEPLVAGTKTASLGGTPESMILRLEDKSTCTEGVCLTVIGRIENGSFQSYAMFFAPGLMTGGDVFPRFLGQNRRPPIFFFENADFRNPGKAVSVLETPKGWIVSAVK